MTEDPENSQTEHESPFGPVTGRLTRTLAAHPTACAAMVLGAISLGLFADVLIAGPRIIASADDGDAFAYFAQIRQFGFGELAAGNLALWNPFLFSGTPFLGGFQSALLYPLNLTYLVLPVGTAIDLDFAIHVFLAGFLGYLWVKGRGVRPLASFFSGCVLVFGSAFFLRILAGQLTLVAAMAWAPLLLLAVDRLIDRPGLGWTLVGIGATTLMILAGYPAAVYATGVAVGLSVAFQWPRCPAPLRTLSCLAAVALAPAFIGAAQLWPGLTTAAETLRAGGVPFDFATSFSLPLENLIALLAPTFYGDTTLLEYWGRWYYWDVTLYIGIVGLFLAAHGVIFGERRMLRGDLWVALILLLIAFGSNTPLYALLHSWVPGFDTFRAPSKFAFQASLFLALLAGVGAQRLLESPRGARGLAVAGAITAAVLAAAGAWAQLTANAPEGLTLGALFREIEGGFAPSFTWRRTTARKFGYVAGPFTAQSLWVAATVSIAMATLLWYRTRRPRLATVLVIFGCLEVLVFAATHRERFSLEQIRVPRMEGLIAQLDPGERFYWALAGNRALDVEGLSLWGYDPVMMARYGEFIAATQPKLGRPLDLTVAYPGEFHPLYALFRCGLRLELDASPIERLDAMPRFALMRDHRVVGAKQERLDTLLDPEFDWRRIVLLEESPGSDHPAGTGLGPLDAAVRVIGESTDHVDFEASIDEPAVLLVTDTYSAGWRARALGPDGNPSQAAQAPQEAGRYDVLPANHAQIAIPLAAGDHRIRLEYAPPSVRAGMISSLLGGIAYAAAAGVWWQRRRFPPVFTEDPASVADE